MKDAMSGIINALAARQEEIALMDRAMHGPPEEWPEQFLVKGAPVWFIPVGRTHLGICDGVIDYAGEKPSWDSPGKRSIGILTKHCSPLTDTPITYALLESHTFWPRSVEL